MRTTSSTVEDYLKCILLAEPEGGGLVTTGQIASALSVTPGTATTMVKALADSGLAHYQPYCGAALSESGRKLATHVVRRHRILETFLVQVMGMDWAEVHDEAEHLEHAVSDSLVERMHEMIGNATSDPHGDPIPSACGKVEKVNLPTLLECPEGVSMRVARVTAQDAEFLRMLERHKLVPGNQVLVEARDKLIETVALRPSGEATFSVGFGVAAKVLVEPL